jgi:hypothetical protein
MRTADDMEMAVILALHGVVAEVREQAEAARAKRWRELRGDAAHITDMACPEFFLGDVFLGHSKEHDGRPAEDVLDDDVVCVLVEDVGSLLPGYNVAEDTVRSHRNPRASRFAEGRLPITSGIDQG